MPKPVRQIAAALLLIGAGSLILASSVAERTSSDPIAGVLYSMLKPFQEAVFAVRTRVRGVWQDYVDLVNVRQENAKLKRETEDLRRERSALLDKERETAHLRKLLNLREAHDFPSLMAQIIGEDGTGWYKTVFVDRGSNDGIRPQMAAVTLDGLVGKVTATSASVSRVILVTDPSLAVDCRVSRTRDRGIVSGHLDEGCILRFIDVHSTVQADDEIVTSGLDGIFPKGLLVGRVKSVRQSSRGLFLEALVRPAVDLRKVEEILIILGQPGGFDIRPGLEAER